LSVNRKYCQWPAQLASRLATFERLKVRLNSDAAAAQVKLTLTGILTLFADVHVVVHHKPLLATAVSSERHRPVP
jgi:hypothetical protein